MSLISSRSSVSRRQVLLAGGALGAAAALPRTAWAAGYSNTCHWVYALFAGGAPRRFGYLTALEGLGITTPLQTINARFAYVGTPSYAGLSVTSGFAKVVGLLAAVSWSGDVGSKIAVTAYVPPASMNLLKAAANPPVKSRALKSLGLWVANYDATSRVWYEEFHPVQSPLAAMMNATSPTDMVMNIAPQPAGTTAPLKDYWQVYFEVLPTITYAQHSVATSPTASSKVDWVVPVKTNP